MIFKCFILFFNEWWVPKWLLYAIGLETFAILSGGGGGI